MKALLYAFAGCLYAMQICVICWAVFLFNDIPFGFIFLIFAAVFCFAAVVLGSISLAFGISQISNPKKGMIKTVMIVKLILIPFFIGNFIIGVLVFAAFANPFLFFAGFVIIPMMLFLTYAAMFVTSSYNVGAMIHRIRSGQNTSGELALFIASQFIYLLDVVGAILIFVRQRNEEKTQTV